MSPSPTRDRREEAPCAYEKRSFVASSGVSLPYRLFVPDNCDPELAHPMVTVLHGSGERGVDNVRQLGLGVTVFSARRHQRRYPSLVLVPQCRPNHRWVDVEWDETIYSTADVPISADLAAVEELIDVLTSEFNVDRRRLYLVGLSMGGYGTWDLGVRRADLFAALVPICGGADPSRAAALREVAVWGFHGADDTVVPPTGTRAMVAALKRAGGPARYTEYEGVAHDAWTPTFSDDAVIDWMFAQAKSRR
ncbi:MAG: PHB depolymerase family esterase [Myxococcota bacterium]